jgi:ATP-binding cassette subfamily B protein
MMPAGHDHDCGAPARSDIASIRRAWAMTGSFRGKVARGILFRFLQSMALGLSFGVVIWVVTSLADGRVMKDEWAWQATGLMGLSLLGQVLFGLLSANDSWIASYQVAGELRLSMLDRLRRLPMGFHLSRHRGDTVTVLTSDMQMVEVFLSDGLPRIAQTLGLPVIVFGFLLARDWIIAAVALVSIAAAVPVFIWSSKRLSALAVARQDIQAEAAASMIEFVQGISVIRAFNQSARGQERFRAALDRFHRISIRMVVQLTVPVIGFAAIVMLGVPLVILTSGYRFLEGDIPAGTMITVLGLLMAIYAPLTALTSVMETARMADASLARMDRIMTAAPLRQTPAPKKPTGFAVSFDRVTFGYRPGTPVLKTVSFDVPERSMFALVGPSGSGKSTILNLIARFWEVDGGAVRIGGVDVRDMDEEALNGLLTVVFQDVYLFAGTIFENIAIGKPGADAKEIEAAAQAAQAHAFIMALPQGYNTRVGEGGAALSGGERQRVSIARAILKDAPIVLLDEATAAIDPTSERQIQMAIAELVANRTLIVVAHKLSTIQAADRILVVERGAILEAGKHEELLAKHGLYAGLWWHRIGAAGWHIGAAKAPDLQ